MSNLSNDDKLAFEILNILEYSQEREAVNLAKLFNSLISTYGGNSNKRQHHPVNVDLLYNGLRLGEHFEENDFKAMFHDFRKKRKIHAKYAIKIFDETLKLLKKLPNIQEFDLKSDNCVVVGDLHGHFDDLVSILCRFNIPGKSHYFVFNGDWVDRGSDQIEVILTIFYAFILYPNRVILNRGNHEDPQQNSHWMYSPCLKETTDKYFDNFASIVYQKLDEVFSNLPLACIINNSAQNQRIFVVHGGINKNLDLKVINQLDRTLFSTVCRPNISSKNKLEIKHVMDVQDMLWSDPYPSDEEDSTGERDNKLRNIGKHFGSDVTKAFLSKHGLTMIIRSHECKNFGYKLMHDNKLMTVFSASNYNHDNDGSIIRISSNNLKFEVLTYKSLKVSHKSFLPNSVDKLTGAISKLRTHLFNIKSYLLRDFKALDRASNGVVTISQLISVLNKYLPNLPFAEIKDRICECDDEENKAKYETLFDQIELNSKYEAPECINQNFEILKIIFDKIDVDCSGYITLTEFKNACKNVLNSLGVEFSKGEIKNFMNAMDVNKDGRIDLQEFKSHIPCSSFL